MMQAQTEEIILAEQLSGSGGRKSALSDSKLLARLASQALIQEAELTPKPGLVDRRGAGAHHDLSLDLMIVSARVLEPYFEKMAQAAKLETSRNSLRTRLGRLGRDAETAMLKASRGVNTHRGAIWTLGLLIAGASMNEAPDEITVCRDAGHLARLPDAFAGHQQSHGEEVFHRYGARGARGEAMDGFPHVLKIGIPALRKARAAKYTETTARIDALLAIMSSLVDTCLLHRGGLPALVTVQQGARRVGELGGSSTYSGGIEFEKLERSLLRLCLSPGGSADVLAATLFLDQIHSSRSHLG
jgi:triphosphoribosyl-dephospho-CoA synthase